MKPLQFYLRNLKIPNPSNSKRNKFTENQDRAPLEWFLRIPSRFYPENRDQQARLVYVASKSTWYPLARPNILVKSKTKKPPRFYPRNRNLKSTSQNSKRNRFTKNRVTSILPSKSTPFEASIPPFLFSLRNEKRKKKLPRTIHPGTLHLWWSFLRRISRPATGRPRRKRNDRSNDDDGVLCERCVCVCVCVCMYVCVDARVSLASCFPRQGVVDGRGRTGCSVAFHCLPVNAHTPQCLDIDWRRSRATWLLREPPLHDDRDACTHACAPSSV